MGEGSRIGGETKKRGEEGGGWCSLMSIPATISNVGTGGGGGGVFSFLFKSGGETDDLDGSRLVGVARGEVSSGEGLLRFEVPGRREMGLEAREDGKF